MSKISQVLSWWGGEWPMEIKDRLIRERADRIAAKNISEMRRKALRRTRLREYFAPDYLRKWWVRFY